jgi:hypothetical protein
VGEMHVLLSGGASGGLLDVLSQVDYVLLLLNAEVDRLPREAN